MNGGINARPGLPGAPLTWRIGSPALLLILGVAGCGSDKVVPSSHVEPRTQAPPAGQAGETVEIRAQTMTSGFQMGRIREDVSVEAFAISRYPVTIGAFKKCVAAGSCEAPSDTACPSRPGEAVVHRPNYGDDTAAEDVAVTCVGVDNARAYCSYVGGRLPTLEEWLLAARGAAPRRFSWGDAGPTCEQHPFAVAPVSALNELGIPQPGEKCQKKPADLGRVGRFSAGASPSGVEDVLLTSAELIDLSSRAALSACRASADSDAAKRGACVAYGMAPGAIDSVMWLRRNEQGRIHSPRVYGFRCAW